eukprot:7489034-Karenia_brevis.AAC.1
MPGVGVQTMGMPMGGVSQQHGYMSMMQQPGQMSMTTPAGSDVNTPRKTPTNDDPTTSPLDARMSPIYTPSPNTMHPGISHQTQLGQSAPPPAVPAFPNLARGSQAT